MASLHQSTNPFKQSTSYVTLSWVVDKSEVAMLEDEAADVAVATSSFEVDEAAHIWRVQVICEAQYAERFEHTNPTVAKLEDKDWVSLVQQSFPAFSVGRFYIYGSHIEGAVPLGKIPIQMDAGAAFGTGEHGSTSGCLLAIEWLKKRYSLPLLRASALRNRRLTSFAAPKHALGRVGIVNNANSLRLLRCWRDVLSRSHTSTHTPRMLDVGCGTAILGIAMAECWRKARVTATDLDPVAVRVAAVNVKQNRVSHQVKLGVSMGYRAPMIHGKYDIICANILARPLMRLAKDARKHLASGGYLVLAGLTREQANMVRSAHLMQGLKLVKTIHRTPWVTLILRK